MGRSLARCLRLVNSNPEFETLIREKTSWFHRILKNSNVVSTLEQAASNYRAVILVGTLVEQENLTVDEAIEAVQKYLDIPDLHPKLVKDIVLDYREQ